MYHILFIHSYADGHLGGFHLLTIVHNVAMNTVAQISLQISAFNSFGYIFRSKIVRSYSNSIFNFLRNCHIVFYSGYTILHPHQECTRVRGYLSTKAFNWGCKSSAQLLLKRGMPQIRMNGRLPLGAVGHLWTGLAKFRGKKVNRIEKTIVEKQFQQG